MKAYTIASNALTPVEKVDLAAPLRDVFLICDCEELTAFYQAQGFDRSTLKDCAVHDDYCKSISFDKYDFYNISYFQKTGTSVMKNELNLYVGKDYVIVVTDDPGEAHAVEVNVAKGHDVLKGDRHDYVLYMVFDYLLDTMFAAIEGFEDDIDNLEIDVMSRANDENFKTMVDYKSLSNMIRKHARSLVYLGEFLELNENDFISKANTKYFAVIDARLRKLLDFSLSLSEQITQLQSSYDSAIQQRQNKAGERLSFMAFLVGPLTVITGIYGMNFKYMPEISWKLGYPLAILGMIIIDAVFFLSFRRKK